MADEGSIPKTLWAQRIPLMVVHSSMPENPLITSIPRFSYLALILTRVGLFFQRQCSSFHYEDIQLRNLPVGLLVDLYRPSLPWKLVVGEGENWDISDTFLNSAKEADYVRNGNANQIMKMSHRDTTGLWNGVKDNDYESWARINARLLNTPTMLKNVPIRIYIPHSPQPSSSVPQADSATFRVVQTLIPALLPASGSQKHPTRQTLGVALRTLMPELFPSGTEPVGAKVIMHGVEVPFTAPLEELMLEAAYPDGWLSMVVGLGLS